MFPAIEKQRCETDCSVCCAAMALRRSYEDVVGVAGDALGWDGRRFDDVFEHYGYDLIAQPQVFRPKQPAIFSVPSRLNEGHFHAVYYEDGRIYDPTIRAFPYDLPDVLRQMQCVYQWNESALG